MPARWVCGPGHVTASAAHPARSTYAAGCAHVHVLLLLGGVGAGSVAGAPLYCGVTAAGACTWCGCREEMRVHVCCLVLLCYRVWWWGVHEPRAAQADTVDAPGLAQAPDWMLGLVLLAHPPSPPCANRPLNRHANVRVAAKLSTSLPGSTFCMHCPLFTATAASTAATACRLTRMVVLAASLHQWTCRHSGQCKGAYIQALLAVWVGPEDRAPRASRRVPWQLSCVVVG